MSIQIATIRELLNFNRIMTLKTVDEISTLSDPQSVLSFRPGPGRAHIAWQIMHIAVTEELFATDRLRKTDSNLSDLFPLYQKGSTAGDEIPSLDVIQNTLSQSRANLLETIQLIPEADLELVPEALQERGWTNEMALKVLCWHETHHQGQAHLTLNSWKAAQ
ncbi:DinB family protein [Gimesia algae]|uniref:DinB superfamily protein n=1 Tax=Gimesia algae TaxID=2527971 RepID=A0A517V807_9PLAN|nr:DinB family protein [Gimesia algae]QDT89133.1 DinB superfamily protein [Gimesia algae]